MLHIVPSNIFSFRICSVYGRPKNHTFSVIISMQPITMKWNWFHQIFAGVHDNKDQVAFLFICIGHGNILCKLASLITQPRMLLLIVSVDVIFCENMISRILLKMAFWGYEWARLQRIFNSYMKIATWALFSELDEHFGELHFITAWCITVQSAVLLSHAVCLSVCDIGGSWPHRLKILEANCMNN